MNSSKEHLSWRPLVWLRAKIVSRRCALPPSAPALELYKPSFQSVCSIENFSAAALSRTCFLQSLHPSPAPSFFLSDLYLFFLWFLPGWGQILPEKLFAEHFRDSEMLRSTTALLNPLRCMRTRILEGLFPVGLKATTQISA